MAPICRPHQKALDSKGIGTLIHYPIPPHLSQAYRDLGYVKGDLPITENYADTVLSLPFYTGMTEAELEVTIDCINSFI